MGIMRCVNLEGPLGLVVSVVVVVVVDMGDRNLPATEKGTDEGYI